MIKNKYSFGLVLYRQETRDISEEAINELFELHQLRNNTTIGYQQNIGWHNPSTDKSYYVCYQIKRECFKNYHCFDNFLIELAYLFEDIGKLGLVIGHVDNSDFMWMDYHTFKAFQSNEILMLKAKYKLLLGDSK
jgi:hypothetical protein